MAEHTPTPWFRNGKYEVGPRPRTDDQSDGMLHPVADVFGDNAYADAAFIVKAVNNHYALTKALSLALYELTACARQLKARDGGSVDLALKAARDALDRVGGATK